MRRNTGVLATLMVVLLPTALWAQELILDDSLRGGTQGSRSGGSFSGEGWRVTSKNDSITWHIPTISQGAVEYSVRGLIPNDGRAEGYDKNELFHMYDWTYNNADTNYDGYRNGPYKHFMRKINLADPGKTNAMEMLLKITSDEIEPDTSQLSWDPSRAYRFREEWGPDGAGRCVFRAWRDGVPIMTMSVLGNWTPGGHAVRIAASTRAPLYPDFGAPVDAVFSDLKVWRTSGGTAPPPPPPGGGVPRVGLSGDKLTINGQAAFLLGASYFDAVAWRVGDFNQFAARRFNMIRIWCDWDAANGKSLLDSNGNLVRRQTLIDLVRAAGQRGLVVNVTICAPEGAARSAGARENACRNVVAALAGEPNVYFDVMNEHAHAAGPASHADVARFFSAARSQSGSHVLTVSDSYVFSGSVDTGHVDAELNAGTQMISPHMERTGDWWAQTGNRVRALKGYLASRGRNVPVLLDEDARRGHSGLNPSRDEFFEAARQARDAGAAGWVFHTDAGFNLSAASFFDALDPVEQEVMNGLADVVFGAGGGTPPPSGGSSLASGWESGQPVGPLDQVLYSKDVAGPFNTMSPGPECSPRAGENQHSGSAALMISGHSNAAYAYCYYKMFDDNLSIQSGTKLKYWIWHQGTPKIAVDGQFTDGGTLRDGGFADQHGVSIHPGQRNDPMGSWHYVEVDLSAAAGKTLDYLMVGFDNGGNGFTGPYRAYIDDFSIGVDATAPTPPPPLPPPGAFVTIVGLSSGGPASIATATVNALAYSDRSYPITSLSSRLQDGVLVRLPNNDKYNRSADYLTLSVSEEAFVYVCYDRRGYAVMPRWLDDEAFWSLTGESLSTSDAAACPMVVFVRRAQAGTVVLGGNYEGRDTGAQSNYVVVVQPAAGRTPGGGLEEASLESFGAIQEGPIASYAFVSPGDSDGDGLTDSFERTVGLDPFDIFTKASGVPDEVATDSSGRTYFEAQSAASAPSPKSGEGGTWGCGLTGVEALLLLILCHRLRKQTVCFLKIPTSG
jgi:hypothetical protein